MDNVALDYLSDLQKAQLLKFYPNIKDEEKEDEKTSQVDTQGRDS